MRRRFCRLAALAFLLQFSAAACTAPLPVAEISQEQAIELARPHVSFEPETVDAEEDEDEGRPVWRVIFRGAPGPHPMGRYMEVLIDRRSGEVVGLARG